MPDALVFWRDESLRLLETTIQRLWQPLPVEP
jgi:hypothetical protein